MMDSTFVSQDTRSTSGEGGPRTVRADGAEDLGVLACCTSNDDEGNVMSVPSMATDSKPVPGGGGAVVEADTMLPALGVDEAEAEAEAEVEFKAGDSGEHRHGSIEDVANARRVEIPDSDPACLEDDDVVLDGTSEAFDDRFRVKKANEQKDLVEEEDDGKRHDGVDEGEEDLMLRAIDVVQEECGIGTGTEVLHCGKKVNEEMEGSVRNCIIESAPSIGESGTRHTQEPRSTDVQLENATTSMDVDEDIYTELRKAETGDFPEVVIGTTQEACQFTPSNQTSGSAESQDDNEAFHCVTAEKMVDTSRVMAESETEPEDRVMEAGCSCDGNIVTENADSINSQSDAERAISTTSANSCPRTVGHGTSSLDNNKKKTLPSNFASDKATPQAPDDVEMQETQHPKSVSSDVRNHVAHTDLRTSSPSKLTTTPIKHPNTPIKPSFDPPSSSPSTSTPILSSPAISLPSSLSNPKRRHPPTLSTNDSVLLAELKTMKIQSLTSRNTALQNEILAKRQKLEEMNALLKHPPEETVKRHIRLLHEYNDVRDVGQGLLGLIADNRGVRVGELYEEFGVGLKD